MLQDSLQTNIGFDDSLVNIIVDSFPWTEIAIAAVLSTAMLMAIGHMWFHKPNTDERGVKFRIVEVLVYLFSTIVVSNVTGLSTFASYQNFLFNAASVFTASTLVYHLVGYPVIEKRLGPALRDRANAILDKFLPSVMRHQEPSGPQEDSSEN